MRLLRLQDGQLSLTKFDKQIPSYAILSHTWGAAEDEVTFEDVSRNEARNKMGYEKISFCAEQAAIHNLEFFWVDTCCINKTDVQEFQTAINSMYRWYQNAEVCFVYMADVDAERGNQIYQESTWKMSFRQSRWFTRSWTLQELLAPRLINFYSRNRQPLGNKKSLAQELEAITSIPASTLLGVDLSPFSLEKCILWARDRKSTYEEDQAYSLLGLCGVSMAPNYGEGAEEAFERLRERCYKKLSKERTAFVYKTDTKTNWNYSSHSYQTSQLVTVDRTSLFARTRTNDIRGAEIEPINKTTRPLVDLFDISLTALRKFQDEVSNSLYGFVESEIEKLQKCRTALLRSISANSTADELSLYNSIASLLTSIDEVFTRNLSDSNIENQKLFKGQGHFGRRVQSDSKSISFRDQINHTAQFELLTKMVRLLSSWLMPGDPHIGPVEITAWDDGEFLRNGSKPYEFWMSEFQKIRAKKTKEREAKTRKEVNSWILQDYIPNEVYDRFAPERLEDTCDWILEREIFRSWSSNNFPGNTAKIMWIHGPAGFGKTVLCTRIIKRLSSEIQAPIAHFFFSNDSEREDPYMAIRSWTSQLMGTPQALDLAYNAREADCISGATRSKMVDLFQAIVHSIPGCTFVLDGLDECCWEDKLRHRRNSVVEFLGNLKQAIANTDTRILIASRNEPEIQRGLDPDNQGLYEYRITIDDVRSDIEKYSKNIIERNLSKKKVATKQELSMRLADRCEGQFLWLRMQENSLDNLMTERQLRKAIETTPARLDQIYDPNWKKIMSLASVQRDRAITILRWVAFTFRPLTVGEIVEAQAITDDCEDLPVDDIQEFLNETDIEKQILKYCGSLLEVRSNPTKSFKFHTVHLTHFTVKQYLASHMPLTLPSLPLFAHEVPSQPNENGHSVALGRICLQYVNFPSVWRQPMQASSEMSQQFLRDYAAGSWYRHAAAKQPVDQKSIGLINTFFDVNNPNWILWRSWFDSIGSDHIPRESGSEESSPLYYATLLEFPATVQHLLQKPDLGHDQRDKGTALRAACRSGNLDIVSNLLEAGALRDSTDAAGSTPANISSSNGHPEVVRMLLDKGADWTVADNDGRTPLYSASCNGHPDVVQLLLEKGADWTVSNNNGWTPLNAASSNGQTEVVRMLLEKGADWAVADNDGWTPLNAASDDGYIEVVRMLLDKGADWAVANNNGWTPLNAASCNGHTEVVRMLLEKGADWVVANNDGSTPLNAASCNGHIEVVRMLLEKGADWAVADNDGCTPLYSASCHGHPDVVQLLLEKGADWTVPNINGSTPLYSASCHGHPDVVQLLLEKGADWTVPNNNGWTPLNAASDDGYIEVVRMLLEKGADWAVADNDGCTPLYSASCSGYTEVVQLFLEKGAEMSILTKAGEAPIHGAALGGYSDVIQSLLRHGADMRALDICGRPPFFYAIRAGDPTSFTVLKTPEFLEPEFQDIHGSNALSVAVRCGHEEMIRDLISEHSLMVEDRFGRTPVWWAHKQGYMHMVEHNAVHPGPAGSLNLPTESPGRFAAEGGYCDVCLASLEKAYYKCKICCAGSFAMCLGCFDVGARCLADDHTLTLSDR